MTQGEFGQDAAQQNGHVVPVETVPLDRWSAQMWESLQRLRAAIAEGDH